MYMLLDVYMQNLAIPNIIGKRMFDTYEEAKNEAINQAEAEFQNYYQKCMQELDMNLKLQRWMIAYIFLHLKRVNGGLL